MRLHQSRPEEGSSVMSICENVHGRTNVLCECNRAALRRAILTRPDDKSWRVAMLFYP